MIMEIREAGELPMHARKLLTSDGEIFIATKNGCVLFTPVFCGEADAQAVILSTPAFKSREQIDAFLDGVIECALYVRHQDLSKIQ